MISVSSDWVHPYPFRVLSLSSEHDRELGQWEVDCAVLGLGLHLTWVYNPQAEVRAKLADMLADDGWLESSMVSMPFADYKKLTDAAAKWEALQ